MIDLSVVAAGGPIVLGVAVGIIGRRAIKSLEHKRSEQRPLPKATR